MGYTELQPYSLSHFMSPTIAATFRLAGLFALSCGLFVCGQSNASTPTSTVQTAVVSPQKQSSEASSQPKHTEIASSPAASSKSERSSTGYSAAVIYTEFKRLTQKACQKQEKVVGKMRYTLCTMTDSQGLTKTVSASSSLASEGDGAGYWLNENGNIYAIRYFHSGEVIVLLPDDRKALVELVGEQEIKVITDVARWNWLERGARDQIRAISRQFDSVASTPKPSDNSDRQNVERIALRFMNNGATGAMRRATIQKLAIVDDTALLSWKRGETGGTMLLRKNQETWLVLTSGGGAINLMTLSEYNVPRSTGQALLKQLNLN
jgi:hypothetical protein